MLITLPASTDADLKWDKEKALAECCAQKGEQLLWQIDLGLESGALSLGDPARFFSYGIALEQFSREIWPLFQNQTIGVSLYRGAYDIDERLLWDASLEEHYREFAPEISDETRKQFFTANVFADFLHRLISYLPAEVTPFCHFDIQKITNPALAACLFSRARFEYLHLVLDENVNFSSTLGVVLPQDAYCTDSTLGKLNKILIKLQKNHMSFRMIPESLLIEEWDGLDTLQIISAAISPSGKRMLQGFRAAGGEIIE